MTFDPKSWLHETKHKFADAFESDDFNAEKLPEGKYNVRVHSVIMKTSRSGNTMIEWTFEVIDGKYIKRKHWKHNVINSDKNANYFRRDLQKCGVTPGAWTDINETLKTLLDLELEIEIVTSTYDGKSFRNTNIIGKSISGINLPF